MGEESVSKRLREALDGLVYIPSALGQESERSPAYAKGQVWDRRQLFKRLQTFKAGTWFAKPGGIRPQDCALRGWCNTALDTLSCEFCHGQVHAPIPPDTEPVDVVFMAQRYEKLLVTAHDASCPWRSASCPVELLSFPLASSELLERELAWRTMSLQRVACLPPLTPSAVDTLLGAAETSLPRFLEVRGLGIDQNGTNLASQLSSTSEPALQGTERHALRAAVMALTGWTAEALAGGEPDRAPDGQEEEVVEPSRSPTIASRHLLPEQSSIRCTLCGAAVGLWSFFPQLTAVGIQQGSVSSLRGGAKSLGLSSPPGSSPAATIAGGLLGLQGKRNSGSSSDTSKMSGPFGLPTAKPLFGSPIRPLPTVNRQPTATSHTIAGGSFGTADGESRHSGAFGAEHAAPFGFASLAEQMQERGSSSGTLQQQGGKRKRDDNVDEPASIPSAEAMPAKQQLKGDDGVPLFLAGSAGWYLSKAALQRYATLEPKQLNCLELHRPFCPWIAAATQPGWEVLLEHLGKAEMSTPGSERTSGKHGTAKDWNPLALLSSVLGKVDVKL